MCEGELGLQRPTAALTLLLGGARGVKGLCVCWLGKGVATGYVCACVLEAGEGEGGGTVYGVNQWFRGAVDGLPVERLTSCLVLLSPPSSKLQFITVTS